MRNDLLIHIDSPEPKVLHLALNNINNFIAGCGDESWNVIVVANGPAITQFTKANIEEGSRVTDLIARNVQFQLCANAKRSFNVDEADIIGFQNKYHLPIAKSLCPIDGHTKREYAKNLVKQLNQEHPGAKDRMFHSILNGNFSDWPNKTIPDHNS